MSTDIKLSESEIKLIQLEREKLELKKKEELIKQEQTRIKEIEFAKSTVKRYLEKNKQYVDSIHLYFEQFEKKFPGEFKLVKQKDLTCTEERYEWLYNEEGESIRDENGHNKKEVYFSQKYKLKQFIIQYKDLKSPHIVVEEHIVTSGFSRYNNSKGFKMRIQGINRWKEDNKFLTNVTTIKEKIINKIESDENHANHKLINDIGIPWVIKKVKEKYGNAIKEIGEYGGHVHVEFKNGLEATFYYEYDTEKNHTYKLGLSEVKLGYLDLEQVLETLLPLKNKKD
jgi:hypothetical protein